MAAITSPNRTPPAAPPAGGTMQRLALAAFLLLVLTASLHDIWNADLGFHLAGGRLIDQTHAVPRVDDFSYTARGLPWLDFEWLYQWWTYATWRHAGPAGVIVQHAVLNLLTFLVLAWAVSRRTGITALGLILLMLALVVCEVRFSIRPHAVGRLCFALFLAALLAHRRDPRVRLWPLLLLQVLWVNLHGTYILGLMLAGFLLLDALLERRPAGRPAWLLLGLLLASLATPYGGQQLGSLLSHRRLVMSRGGNPEWMPLPLTLPVLSDPAVWAFVLLAVVAGFLLWRRGARLGWFEKGLWVMALFAPFLHIRALPMSAIVLTLVAAAAMVSTAPSPSRAAARRDVRSVPVFGLVMLLLLLMEFGFVTNTYWRVFKRYARLGLGVSPITLGWGSGRFLADMEDAGNVFNSYATGGWLMWWLYPHGGRVFIDGRDIGNVYTPEVFAEYERILKEPAYFSIARRRYQWNAVVLERDNELCQPLIRRLEQSRAWQVAYSDDESVVFLPVLAYRRFQVSGFRFQGGGG